MKNTFKRTLALALAVIMLLSVSVIGVSAESAWDGGVNVGTVAVYEFWQEAYKGSYVHHGTRENVNADIQTAYENGELNWMRYSESAGYSIFAEGRPYHEITIGEGVASNAFYGLVIKNPGAGTFDLSLDYSKTSAGCGSVKAFLVAESVFAANSGTAWRYVIKNNMAGGNGVVYLGEFSCYDAQIADYSMNTFSTTVTLDAAEGTNYHLVFSADDGDDSVKNGGNKIYISQLALEKTSAEAGSAVDYDFFQGNNSTTISANLETLNAAWAAKTLNWKFENAYNASYYGAKSWFYTKAAGLEQQMCKNGWLAIRIAAPGTGNYDVTVNYSARNRGASSGEMYIWEATSTEYAEADITALVGAATAGTLSAVVTGLDWCATGSSEYETGRSAAFNYNFTEGKDYILAFKALETSTVEGKTGYANILLSSLYASPKANNVATIGEVGYPTVKAALNAAETGETVKLLADCAVADLGNTCNIDLNGHNLTVYGDMTSVGVVSDSKDSTGVLKVTGEMKLLSTEQTQLPLYNEDAAGYGLYAYTWGENNQSEDVEGDTTAKKFWFQLGFEKDAAYDLVASGTSGLEIGVVLNYTFDGEPAEKTCVFAEEDGAEAYAAEWAQWLIEKDPANPWFYVTVRNAIADMTVTPYIAVGDTVVSCAAIAY